MNRYILDEDGRPVAVPNDQFLVWAEWMEHFERRRIGLATYADGAIEVSTVFLGQTHVSKDFTDSREMLYETMVFADTPILKELLRQSETDDRSILATIFGRVDIQRRYHTGDDAKEGHTRMCAFVETCLKKGVLPLEKEEVET